jgi:hypothetical protein
MLPQYIFVTIYLIKDYPANRQECVGGCLIEGTCSLYPGEKPEARTGRQECGTFSLG